MWSEIGLIQLNNRLSNTPWRAIKRNHRLNIVLKTVVFNTSAPRFTWCGRVAVSEMVPSISKIKPAYPLRILSQVENMTLL